MEATQIERALARYQGMVVAILAFVVVFAATISAVMLYQTYRYGQQSVRLQQVSKETHDALCSMKHENEVRLRIFAVSSVGLMPDNIRLPLVDSYKATLASLRSLDCGG